MSKKKTFIGRVLKMVKGAVIRRIPIISDIREIGKNLKEDTVENPKGKLDRNRLVWNLLIGGFVSYVFIKGLATLEEIQQLIDIFNSLGG